MNILVTGANGFVGRVLCKRMLADGYQVRGAVRGAAQMTAVPSGIEGALVGDISPKTDWSKALIGVDAVVHLAARVHIMNDMAPDPLAEFRYVNVAATKRLAQTAAATGCRRFVYMSSVKVNGEGGPTPYSEEDAESPQDPYSISKWEAEQELYEIARKTGMEVVVLRAPLVYGPEVKANFLRLLKVVARGIPLPLANVNNRRSMIYLGNLVDAIVTCITHPGAAGQTYLVSDGEDVSTPELIRRIGVALNYPARMFPFPLSLIRFAGNLLGKSAAVERLLGSLTVDTAKIRRELNWTAPYTMAAGLKETAQWYLKKIWPCG